MCGLCELIPRVLCNLAVKPCIGERPGIVGKRLIHAGQDLSSTFPQTVDFIGERLIQDLVNFL